MEGDLKTFGNVSTKLARNPLGVIALFIVLIYGFAALVTVAATRLEHDELIIIVSFLTLFPLVVIGVFGWLVAYHHTKLWAPGDFLDQKDWFHLADTAKHTADTALAEIRQTAHALSLLHEMYLAERQLSVALSPIGKTATVSRARRLAVSFLAKDSSPRPISMLLARLYFEKYADKSAAIAVLTRYIDCKNADPDGEDIIERDYDLAHAHYNRACYTVTNPKLKAYIPTNEETTSAIQDLATAITKDSTYIRTIDEDDDLKWLREHSPDVQSLQGIVPEKT